MFNVCRAFCNAVIFVKENKMRTNWIKILLVLLVLDISLFAGWVVEDNRPFTLRNTNGMTGDNIYGDFNVTGAPIMCASNGNNNPQCNWSYSGYLFDATGLYLTDIPTSKIPLNSSSADLTIPSDATITKAYLYWSGHIYGTTGTQAAYDAATAGYDSVIFRTPDGTNHNVTATQVDRYAFMNNTTGTKGFRLMYQATVDVTSIVQNGGYASNKQTFTVGNLKVTSGTDNYLYDLHLTTNVKWGPMGGWSLIVEYTRPIASGQKYKNVSIYDGFRALAPNFNTFQGIDINVSGFLTPLSQIPTGTMAFYTMGSERKITGEQVQISNKSGTMNNLTNSANLVGKQLNDTITINSAQITSGRDFNPGIDLDTFEVSTSCKTSGGEAVACIDKNQTSTTLRLGIQAGSNSFDQSFPGMLALSLDIYQPNISSFRKDSNTTSTQKLNPGDTVKYALDFNNSGTEAASKVTIYDTFSSTVGGDMLLNVIDRNVTALNNSIRLTAFGSAVTHCAIGSTDPACATLPKDANCSVDYADNNTSKATKLWCYIPYMAVNDRYLMSFNATVRSDYNQSTSEQNVTNVAYSQYYNAATNELVTIQGQSNVNTAGTVGGAVAYAGKLDVVDNYDNTYSYNNPVGLKTKVANKNNTTLTAVYLGIDPSNYQPTIYNGNNYDMLVLFTLSDNNCTENNPISSSGDVTATFLHNGNQYTAVSNTFTMISKAKQIGRVKANFIDWNKISFSSFNGNNCVNQSSINGNLKGVPECVNGNSDKLTSMFNYDISVCVTAQAGKDAACDSNAYNANGSKGNIAPAKYNNTYGCLMCLSDAVNSTNNCSQDNFAIRPDRFVINSTSPHYPNLLRAGQGYLLNITAVDKNALATQDYNQTSNNLTSNSTKWLNTSPRTANINTLPYNGDVNVSTVNFLNGVSQSGSTFKYADVGALDMNITDQNWAAVDNDDTPMDCTGTYICGDVNVTFIPDHFDFNVTSITNNDGPTGTFTYLSNQIDQMAARVNAEIRALNKDGNVTLNFATSPMWENNVTVIPMVTKSTYLYPDANESNITNLSIGFTSGVKDINWSETNSSKYLRFNFKRDVNQPFNPFVVNPADMNLSVSSLYTQTPVGGYDSNATTTGSENGLGTGNATFVYGRTHAPRYRFSTNPGIASIYYEVYCDTNGTKALLPNGVTSKGGVDSVGWYLNELTAVVDGITGTVSEKKAAVHVAPVTITTFSAPAVSTASLHYDGALNYPYKTTMENNASSWLIYDKYNNAATTNEFEVEFYNSAVNWTGIRNTNTTTDSNATTTTSKRILW
jgi:hypothetical protein